jgi:ferric-dicitrate binding protein FerR (iron transport regulator)
MSLQTPVTENLLRTYFAGQASALQKRMVEEWMKDARNEEVFYACLHEWEMENLSCLPDVSRAIGVFQDRIADASGPLVAASSEAVRPLPQASGRGWRRWLAAASVVLALGLAMGYFREALLFKTYATGYGQTAALVLPDGSHVTLNANSQLRVPRLGFGSSIRQVYLHGEADFSVVHTPDDQRFMVRTDSMFKVEVLGTEFTVFARARQTKVVLTKGKVKVHYGKVETSSRPLILTPGDVVTVDKKQNKLQVKKVARPGNYAAWKHNRFVFENTSLLDIRNMLAENYGLEVLIKGDTAAAQTVSGSFQAHSVNELLQALSEVLEVNVIRQDNHVILIGN